MKRKKVRWRKLDNSAKIFPIISNKRFSSVFRVSVLLKEKIDENILKKAVENTVNEQIAFKVKLRKGFFWYYFEYNEKSLVIEEENEYPCRYIDVNTNNGYLFKVTYFDKKINLDVFHSLTDGNTAIKFLQEIVYNYLDLKEGKNVGRQKLISNNIEDSYLKNYDKKKAKRSKSNKAYILQGKNLPIHEIGVIHEFIDLENLKKISKQNKATITEYLTAVLVYSIYKENYIKNNIKRPIKVCIPVDLKKYFKSTTSSNFFSYMSVEVDLTDRKYNFEGILEKIKKEFSVKLTQKEIESTMASNIKLGNNLLVKLVPLLIKKFTVNLSYIEIRKYSTTTISNLGKVDVKDKYKDKIENFLFLLAPESVEKTKCSICSYGNNLVFSFTSILKDAKIQTAFCNFLKNQGINVQIESNGVYDVIS